MAIKQRALRKLNMTKNHVLHAMGMGSKASLDDIYRNLIETRDLYWEGLSQQNYAAYGEIYDGLILAVLKMMEDGETDDQEEALLLCAELLEHLEKKTRKETLFKKEILFLPYISAMWDSLESVWKAAYEDKEHCNAYVMPIPYFNLNPDGSVAAWHCERDMFPKYVPTLDWREIDLKAWHPDVIFYHTPYDDYNLVTSVESRYYSRNLKECADKLVYIPYFVLDEPFMEEEVEHFVTTPGVLNADKVIVQSEAMKELYINILIKRTNQPDRAYWENRISGVGSPKIEKVLTSKKEDFDMPEKWNKLIKGKKIILYNTSLSAMLKNADKVCNKLRYIFDVFRNRDDLVLWWRPHPLMKSTFHSMKPQFEEEYLGLEKQYIEEGWGIYDDSSDLHRAICWSDAYYGDGSSVATLYKLTQKPILFQSVMIGISTQARINRLDKEGHFGYGLEEVRQGIIRIDFRTSKIDKFITIPRELTELWGYNYTCKVGNKLIILPNSKDKILEFDLSSQKFVEAVSIKNDYAYEGGGFSHCVIYKNFRYFTGLFSSIIIRYDVLTGEYAFLTEWFSIIRSSIKYDASRCDYGTDRELINNFCVADDSVYFTIGCSNIVLEMNLDTEAFAIHSIGSNDSKYLDIDYDGKDFWLLPRDNLRIVKWNRSNGEIEICDFSSISEERDLGYRNIRCRDGNLEIYPGKEHKRLLIDAKEKTVIQCSESNKTPLFILETGKQGFVECLCSMRNDYNNVFEYCEDNFWEITVGDSRKKYNRYLIDTSCLNEILPPSLCFRENCELLFQRFIDGVCHDEFEYPKKEKDYFPCGEEIYQALFEE